jgi:hypothetical protein
VKLRRGKKKINARTEEERERQGMRERIEEVKSSQGNGR